MELRHIRYFLAVVEEGSFTKAAEKLLIAQPPLSRQIKDLEEEIGTPLFLRKARGLQLTEAGMRFLQYASQIVHLADQSLEDISEMSTGLKGTLYITSVEGRAPRLLAKWIAGFNKLYPMVDFNLWNGNTDDVCNRVYNGLCDIGIITAPYDQEGLRGIEVYDEPWIAMIPVNHPLAEKSGESIDLIELADYDLLIPSRESRRQEIEEWFAPLNVKPKIRARIAHMLNAYELTANGLGIAIFPAAAAEYAEDDVVVKTINGGFKASYVMVRSNERESTLLAKEFISYVKDALTQPS